MSRSHARTRVSVPALLLSLVVFSQLCTAQLSVSPTSVSILITNVKLTDQQDSKDETLVNILIRDKVLDLVTEDPISAATASLTLDARGGVLLGNLELGKPPSFIILDGDPRDNFTLLLATEKYTRFSYHDGKIIRNWLSRVIPVAEEPLVETWFAYTPPPYALATSYQDPTAWNRWDGTATSGVFGGVIALDGVRWPSQDRASKQQVGDLKDFSGSELRAFEVGITGTLNFENPWIYTLFAADNTFDSNFDVDEDNTLTFRDVRLDIPVTQNMSLAVGKQKEPISLERITSLLRLPYQERSSASDALLTSRNVGLALSGSGFDQRITWAGGVFNDWLDDDGAISDNSTQLIGRLTWLPIFNAEQSHILHLGFGARYSNAREDIQYLTKPELSQAPVYVDTGLLRADDVLTYDVEAYWQAGPVWLGGEYTRTELDAPALHNPVFNGYHLMASWVMTGEARSYNKRAGIFHPFGIARSVDQNGWGSWEAFARYSAVDLTDESVEGGEMEILSLGLNWMLSPLATVSVNYRYILLDRFELEGESSGFNLRLVLFLN